MKVLVLAAAGGEAHRRMLGEVVRVAAGHAEVRVLAPDAVGAALRSSGVPIESWQPAGLFDVLRSVGALRLAVERDPPDVVHAVGWTAAAVALGVLTGAPAARTIVTLVDPIHEHEMPKPFVEKRLPELLRRAPRATCVFPGLRRELVERFGVDPARVTIVPYGVAPRPLAPAVRPAGRAGPLLGAAAPADRDDGWQTAIATLAYLARSLPEARLHLPVRGSQAGRVRAFARGLGVEREVLCDAEGAPATEPDLVLVPNGQHGLPYALLQALVDGVPVVAAGSALAETLEPYPAARLVRDDPADFAAAVEELWPRIDAVWASAQAQRAAATAALDPALVAGALQALYADAAGSGSV